MPTTHNKRLQDISIHLNIGQGHYGPRLIQVIQKIMDATKNNRGAFGEEKGVVELKFYSQYPPVDMADYG